uniref:RRM domain-containing protein n=2 Tax=Meloidogyne TaxID=189290 RepID=A0A915MHS2_MELJA
MVESKPRRRSRSSSSSSASSSTSGSSSGSGSSSSSTSSASRSPTPKKSRPAAGRSERPATNRRSPRRGARSRSPRRAPQPKSEKITVSSSRRSPSPAARRRQASPPRHRSRSPVRRSPPRRERERPAASPLRERRERTPEPQPKRVCARNLSRNITKAHLEEIFSLFGVIKSCELPMDRVHIHIPRGYGYIEYEKAEDAEKAIKHMDGGQIDGLEIQCELTLPYRPGRGSSPLGSFGANFGGTKRDRSRSPRRMGGANRSGVSPPSRRPRRSRSPPSRSTGANSIPLGNGGGRFRSPPRLCNMVIAAPATMEEGRILLLGNEADILHSAFTFPLNEGGKRVDHYAYAQILTQLGLDEVHVLALLATTSSNVSRKAIELLQENMPSGHDMNSLSQYLTVSRQSYTMMGLRLRAEQDKRFRQTLMETGDALLIVCDRRDSELGIGMDDEYFVQFSKRHHANAERISAWMHDDRQRPKEVGQNQLGFFLMWLRYELREKEKAKWLSTVEIKDEGVSTDQEGNLVPISLSNFVLSLQGPFQPLSNYYAFTFEMKGCSVEHYVYQRLFEALHLPEDEIVKIRTTVKPVDVSKMAKRLFKRLNIDENELEYKYARLDRWRQSAMKYKITKNEYLQKLLLSTGNAFLLEITPEADTQWACGSDELEYQHLLSKRYITPQLLLQWQSSRTYRPPALSHLGGNKTGLLLMELRTKLASQTTHRIPLITPLTSSVLRSSVSNHMICFSPESVLHPFYPVDIKDDESTAVFPSAIHLAAQEAIEFLDINESNAVWIMEPREGPECWERLHRVICDYMHLPLEIIQQWYQEERQNVLKRAMKMQFEQHPMLLRVLLDTQDALLISCSRFSSIEAELHIGVRERDLRLWLSHVQQDTKQLMDICLRPLAFRPPYIGGNRLGFLLMELRREFILSGVFPHQLPEMTQNVDILLGSESPMENYSVAAPFSILDEINFRAIWANPYLLMLKQQLEEEEGNRSESSEFSAEQWEKSAMLISRDEPQINTFFERLFIGNQTKENDVPIENGIKINGIYHSQTDLPGIDEMPIEMLRSIYIKMAARFRVKLVEMDDLQREIIVRSRDSSCLQDLRRTLERSRENLNAVCEKETPVIVNLTMPPPPIFQAQSSSISIVSQPPPQSSLASSQFPSISSQQLQSSAQWTQAAAISASNGRRPSPTKSEFPLANVGGQFQQKIPSLLPELIMSANAPSLSVTGPPPSFSSQRGGLSTTQPVYGGVRREHQPPSQFSDGNRSRWADRSGRRGGPSHRLGNNQRSGHSKSPPSSSQSFSTRRRARTPPPSHRRVTPTLQHRTTIQREQRDTNVSTTSEVPPPEKKKRVVDESELSEGEILSDDE